MEELNALVLKLLDKYKEYRTVLSEGFERPPVFADGYALNMVRKDIISIKEEISEYCKINHLTIPYEFYFEMPKEVAEDFMVNHDKILSDANWLSNKIMSLHNKMIEKAPFVSSEKRGRCDYSYLVNIYPSLVKAIEDDDFYNMRRLSVCFDHTVEKRCDTLIKMYHRTIKYLEDNQQEQITFVA